jgi:lipopolysaccharide export system protein LptC
VAKGYTVEEPTMRIWSRAEASVAANADTARAATNAMEMDFMEDLLR